MTWIKLIVHLFSPDYLKAKRGVAERAEGGSHLAKSPHKTLKTNNRSEPHLAALYLAISPPTPGYPEIAADSRLSKRAISS